MSFADDLRAAQARMLKQKKEEAERQKGRRKVASGSTSGSAAGGGGSVKNDWTLEDEMIALYLQMSESSKFLIENYSKKRKLSPRAMKMRMTAYGTLMKSPDADVSEQMRQVFQQFGRMDAGELQKLVIQILRGEYTYRESFEQKAIRRD